MHQKIDSMAAIALIFCMSASSWAAEKPTSVANAAGAIFGHITTTEALIARCRDTETAHAAAFDRYYNAYAISASTMKYRVQDLLLTEARRQSVPEDQIRGLLLKAAKDASDEATHLATINPALLKIKCDGFLRLSPDSIDAIGDLRRTLPDDMKMIDQWR
jgi:hypothetical protein